MAFGCLGYITVLFTSSPTFSFNQLLLFSGDKGKKIACGAKKVLRAYKSSFFFHYMKKKTSQQINVTHKGCRNKIVCHHFFHEIFTFSSAIKPSFSLSLCNRTQEFQTNKLIVIKLSNNFSCFASCASRAVHEPRKYQA